MKIALIGYGKMGKAIDEIANANGDEIVLKISSGNKELLTADNLKKADVAIEFTNPYSAVENIKLCINAGVPVVSGSTGWLQEFDNLKKYCKQKKGSFLYASNFSVGVNLFFALNKYLASLMSLHNNYSVSVEETHHTQKKDAPSGTAITLAEDLMKRIKSKTKWANEKTADPSILQITSNRVENIAGIHKIKYESANDSIEIVHSSYNRKGFAEGVLLAAKFVIGKKGVFSMHDVLDV
jgi:4-hydroxy-tetrahydrodipicolinate reductase